MSALGFRKKILVNVKFKEVPILSMHLTELQWACQLSEIKFQVANIDLTSLKIESWVSVPQSGQ